MKNNNLAVRLLSVFLTVLMLVTSVPVTAFAGNNQTQAELKTDNIQLNSTNALGDQINELMTEQQESQSADYSISRLEVEGKTATVEMYNKLSCSVVVAIFEESGRMVGSGTTEVEANTAYATVELDVMTMPEYFVAKAYLLDENMASLCDEFISERNTKNFQEFLDLTVDDFEGMIVVSLEEELADNGSLLVLNGDEPDFEDPQKTNFFVAKEGTQYIDNSAGKNILISMDDENGIYVFENADETLTGVSAGETVYYDCGNYDFILAVVDSVVTENGITTLTAADAEIYDLFECIKIESEGNATAADVDESSLGEGVTLEESEPEIIPNAGFEADIFKINLHIKTTLKNDKGNLSAGIDGALAMTMNASANFYYHIKLFGKDKYDFYFKLTTWREFDLSVFADFTASKDIDVCCVKIPVYAGVTILIDMSVNFSFSGEVHVILGNERTIGFAVKTGEDVREIKEERDWTVPYSQASGTISVSFEIGVGVELVKVFQVTLNFSIGLSLGASAYFRNEPGDSVKFHECAKCIDVGLDFIFGISFELKFGISKRLSVTLVDVDIAKITAPLSDWHYSIAVDGTVSHSKGECKNWSFRTYFTVKDTSGICLEGATVDGVATDKYGECSKRYYNGTYNLAVSKDGYVTKNITITVKDENLKYNIVLEPVKMIGLSVKKLPTKTNYYTGDKLDSSGLVLNATYNNGKTETITSGFTCSPTSLNTAGTQTITVTYNGLTTQFNVSVTQTKATNISVATKPEKLSYFVGDTLDPSGLILTEKYNNGDVKTITSGYTCTPTVLNTAGTQTITVKYGSNTCTYTVDVIPVVATGVAVSVLPTKLSYFVGETLDPSGLVLTEIYNNGKTVTVTSGYTCTPTVLETAGTQTITVTYGGHSCSFDVIVTPVVATEIVVSKLPNKLVYFTGDKIDPTGLVLTETFNNGDVKEITTGYVCTPNEITESGTQKITVSYGDNYTYFNVTVYEATDCSGSCGDKAFWEFDPLTGLLVISGEGDMYSDFSLNTYLDTYQADITEVIIGDNITSIGDQAFYWCDKLENITIGKSVSSIGSIVFYGCNSLKSITIPDNVNIIRPYAFEGSGLTEVVVGNGVTEISYGAFNSCYDLEKVVLGNNVNVIGSWAFSYCESLSYIYIPDSVNDIGELAFYNCINLEQVEFGNNCTVNIQNSSFSYTKIKNLNLSCKSVVDNGGFYNCAELKTVHLGEGVQSVIAGAFNNGSSLEQITVDVNNPYFSAQDGVLFNKNQTTILLYPAGRTEQTYSIPDTVTAIGGRAFNYCANLTMVEIPDSVSNIGIGAFSNCSALTSLSIPDKVTGILDNTFSYCNNLRNIIIPDSVTTIGYAAFYNCESLVNVIIPDNVTTIGNSAFYRCESLTNVIIPDGVTSIGGYAFYGCIGLTSIRIPDGVESLSYSPFSGCVNLVDVTMPASISDYNVFEGCTKIKKLTLTKGNGIMPDFGEFRIDPDSTFDGYLNERMLHAYSTPWKDQYLTLEEVVIEDGVINIGAFAFYGCYSLTKITIPEGITKIGDCAFLSCSSLSDISLPDSVRTIGFFAFEDTAFYMDSENWVNESLYINNCLILGNVKEGTVAIAAGAFAWSGWGAREIIIPQSITYIERGVFAGAMDISEITIHNGVTGIADYAFWSSYIYNLKIPDGVTSIGEYAFYNCDLLYEITIPDSVTSIGFRAFDSCENLMNAYYSGTEEQWANINIEYGNHYLTVFAFIYYNYREQINTVSVDTISPASLSAQSTSLSLMTVMPPIVGVPVNLSVVAAQTSGAVVGNRYTLIALDQTAVEYDLDNLAFIDHTLATGSDVSFSFIPKSADNLIVLIIGDFGSGIEQRVISGAPGIAVTDVRLSYTSLDMYPGQDSMQLTAYITPDSASIKDIIWTSSDTNIASVDKNGVVTPHNPGKATITATSASDGISAECKVNVAARIFEINWVMADGTYTFEYEEGSAITEYENTYRTGYRFIGWDKTVPNRMPATDLTFTALYRPNIYTATFITNGGKWDDGTASDKAVTVEFDADIPEQETPEKQGYIFSGWEYNGENLGTNIGKMISTDGMLFTALWVPANDTRYTVETYTMNENGEYLLSETVLTGTTNEIANITPEIENGFDVNEDKSVLSGKIAADNSLVLKVYIDRKTYSFTTVVDGIETSTDYLYGAAVKEPTAPAREGYTFDGWSGTVPVTMPAENVELTAQWKVNSYTVTWVIDGNKTVETYSYDDVITQPENPAKEGYAFTGWTPSVPDTVPAKNLTFYATWLVNSHDITWNVDGKVTTHNCRYGKEIVKPENPSKEGYTFVGWGADIPETMPDYALEFTAQWKINTYTVTWEADGQKTVDNVEFGNPITKPANPEKTGYEFVGWTPAIPSAMPAQNLTFTAQYELLVKQLKIVNPSTNTVKYGDTLVMHADISEAELPDGWAIEWTVEGAGFSTKVEENGLKFKVTSVSSGDVTVTATLVDENGEVVKDENGKEMTDSKQLKSNASFWQKIVSFFKNLFRISRIILQSK